MSYSAPQTVVNVDSLDKFPFESQCRTALSQLLCHSKTPDKIHYIRFPFGLIDINGLKSIISVFESRAAEKRTLDEKKWLNCDIKNPHSNVLPSSDILSFFHSHVWAGKKSDQISCVQNLVGTHWLTDSTLKYIADIINDTRNDTLCFVLQHPSLLFIDKFKAKLEKIKAGQEVKNIIIVLNIARSENGRTDIALEGSDGGCHWTLLFFQTSDSSTWYYGDSLAWPFPSNHDVLLTSLKRVQEMSGLSLLSPKIHCQALHDSNNVFSKHTCTRKCKPFYPIQTCSSMCGVISAVMMGMLAQDQNLWPNKITSLPLQLEWIRHPTNFSDFMRKTLIN